LTGKLGFQPTVGPEDLIEAKGMDRRYNEVRVIPWLYLFACSLFDFLNRCVGIGDAANRPRRTPNVFDLGDQLRDQGSRLAATRTSRQQQIAVIIYRGLLLACEPD